MTFTGRNLLMVQRGIELALSELHNQIATCPDVHVYAEDLAEIEAAKSSFERLLARVNRAIAKQQGAQA